MKLDQTFSVYVKKNALVFQEINFFFLEADHKLMLGFITLDRSVLLLVCVCVCVYGFKERV